MPVGIAVWTPLAVADHEGGAAWATPATPRTAVDIPIVLTASRPSARRDRDASCTSDSLTVPGSAGAWVRPSGRGGTRPRPLPRQRGRHADQRPCVTGS